MTENTHEGTKGVGVIRMQADEIIAIGRLNSDPYDEYQ